MPRSHQWRIQDFISRPVDGGGVAVGTQNILLRRTCLRGAVQTKTQNKNRPLGSQYHMTALDPPLTADNILALSTVKLLASHFCYNTDTFSYFLDLSRLRCWVGYVNCGMWFSILVLIKLIHHI